MAYIRYYVNDSYSGEIYIDRQLKRGEDLLKLTEAKSLIQFDDNSETTLTQIMHEGLAIINFDGYKKPKIQNADFTE